MDYVRYRKHPRIYKKNEDKEDETVLNLSMATAAGVLALAFAKGVFWGYMLKRKRR